MFPSSYHSSRSKPIDAIQSFDDQDLSTVQFWMLIGNDTRTKVLVGHLRLWLTFSGVLISFLIVIFMVSSLLVYDKLSVKNIDQFHREQTRRLKDFQVSRSIEQTSLHDDALSRHFQELAGLPLELHDLRSILMNEFILEAWKREKNRRERLS